MSLYDPSIFRAYDMRGTYPYQMNEKVAYAAGQAFVSVMGAKKIVIGRDVRTTGHLLQQAAIQGAIDAGASVIDIGVISTEMLYYAAGTLECDGGFSITASHNPPEWNGIKFIGPKALPITKEDKLGEIYDFIQSNKKLGAFEKGSVTREDLLPSYTTYLQRFAPTILPHLKVVGNANFGANGKVIDLVIKNMPIDMVRLNWNEDGSFPKGTPDPSLPANRKEIEELVVKEGAHFGVAWDADADRCFFYDEKGRAFHGYYITALLIEHFLSQEKGGTAIIERRLVWANYDAAAKCGGQAILSRTGHGYFKASMRQHNAIFGGEMSGHFYYRDFFNCDNGMITFLTVLKIFGDSIQAGKPVSALLDRFMEAYPIQPTELNFITEKKDEIIQTAADLNSEAVLDREDGISAEYPDWRFNLRKSDNEPILRLNLEAKTVEGVELHKNELYKFITDFGAKLRDDQ
jgi:phosphomannomutase